jgi:hypothetical protein
MSHLFKKVRIIHSPKERKYTVQEKSILAFRWTHVEDYHYVEVRHLSHGPHDLACDAFARAKEKAQLLLARVVVWEDANFMWGP